MKKKKKNSRGKEAWGQPLCYLGLLHSPFALGYIGVNQLATGTFWSNSRYSSSDGHRALHEIASSRRELLDAAMCRPFLLGASAQVLRPKPVNPPLMVLRPKPPNSLAISVLHTRPPPLDTCHCRPRPAGTPSPLSLARPARPPS
jgi:hypothetical protein